MAIVEGPRMIFDLLANAKTRPLVRQILVSVDDYEKEFRDKLTKFSSSSNYQLQLVAPDVFQTLSDTITPQGIIAVAERPSLSVDPSSRQPIYLVLDGVSDPGNVGTLIRSCLAVGCAGIILLPQCCDAWSPKTLRSSMGASFLLPIVQEKSWENALDRLGSWNVLNENIYAASMLDGGESEAYFDIDWQTSPSALVIGSEGNGLSHEVRNHVQERRINSVYVPMNPGIESLNAAVCGSVVLFEYSRQCNVI
jgi:TrmH family RNA methyltransferase